MEFYGAGWFWNFKPLRMKRVSKSDHAGKKINSIAPIAESNEKKTDKFFQLFQKML